MLAGACVRAGGRKELRAAKVAAFVVVGGRQAVDVVMWCRPVKDDDGTDGAVDRTRSVAGERVRPHAPLASERVGEVEASPVRRWGGRRRNERWVHGRMGRGR